MKTHLVNETRQTEAILYDFCNTPKSHIVFSIKTLVTLAPDCSIASPLWFLAPKIGSPNKNTNHHPHLWLFFCRVSLYFHKIAISNFQTKSHQNFTLPSPWLSLPLLGRGTICCCATPAPPERPPDDFQQRRMPWEDLSGQPIGEIKLLPQTEK